MSTSKLISVKELEELNVLITEFTSVILYPEQLVPIHIPYSKSDSYWVADKDFPEFDTFGRFPIFTGDHLYFVISSTSGYQRGWATSYELYNATRKKWIHLLNVIPDSAFHGKLKDELHYDAITQMKNLDDILRGSLETKFQHSENKVQVTETLIPEDEFYLSNPRSGHGFNCESKVIKTPEGYLVNGNQYPTKKALAWRIYHNAEVILKETNPDQDYHEAWDIQYNFVRDQAISMFVQKKNQINELL